MTYWKFSLFFVILSVFALIAQSQIVNPCELNNEDTGVYYNFTKLAGKDWTGTGSTSGAKYHFSICSSNEFCNDSAVQLKPSSVCAPRPTMYTFGNQNMIQISPRTDDEDGGVVDYQTGSTCGGQNNVRKTTINILCTGEESVQSITEIGNCQVIINVTAACGNHMSSKKGGLGGGWIFVIILLSVSAAYIIFGTIINWKVRHHEGANIFPNIDFWRGFGTLITDGVLFIRGKISGTAYHGYQQV
ncbi:hypothetical protein PPL_12531 [Heterostelium album PN500]|uniref:Autophagy-related protein 27 n=1 Tax=Heterostelium pallidum (strain ATCC 26659 / Pp 5 / PN500) TaxID=670386 RepID=D3BMV8_HETP5|nr:hypothetical protein PPL_12531 [Heterostelium album PN500]EFA77320.1 hypothetical protein PPL_12531 [Heterostelium album PN500]|eukprot:XP_020429449.1 hypothetical protein PPL_12531 [Heterostelium album PN500]